MHSINRTGTGPTGLNQLIRPGWMSIRISCLLIVLVAFRSAVDAPSGGINDPSFVRRGISPPHLLLNI